MPYTYILSWYSIFSIKSLIIFVEKQELPPAPQNVTPHQYTLEELETEILKKSSLVTSSLKIATAVIKGIIY